MHLIYTMKQSSLQSVKKKVTRNFKSYNTPYCANKRNEAKLIAKKWSQKFPSIVWSNTCPKVVLRVDHLSLKYYSCVILSRVLLHFHYKLPNQACFKRDHLVKKFNQLALDVEIHGVKSIPVTVKYVVPSDKSVPQYVHQTIHSCGVSCCLKLKKNFENIFCVTFLST